MSKVMFILCFNVVSFGCLSQLLYNGLLDTINYSALKHKLISPLIIRIRLMNEYVEIARQAAKKKKPVISCHYLLLQIRIISMLCNLIKIWVLRLI